MHGSGNAMTVGDFVGGVVVVGDVGVSTGVVGVVTAITGVAGVAGNWLGVALGTVVTLPVTVGMGVGTFVTKAPPSPAAAALGGVVAAAALGAVVAAVTPGAAVGLAVVVGAESGAHPPHLSENSVTAI